MKILKKENWWIWLLLLIGSQGSSSIVLGALTDSFKKGSWYSKLKGWLMPIAIIVGLTLLALFFNFSAIKEVIDSEGAIFTNSIVMTIVAIIYSAFIGLSLTLGVFVLQISAVTASKLNVPGKEIYLSLYIWIILLIIPIIGWALLFVMILYIVIWPIVMLARGEGEQYIK